MSLLRSSSRNSDSFTSPQRDYRSRKFGLTVYAMVLLPVLLWKGLLTGEHFVTVFPLALGLYFTGNVAAKRWETTTNGSNEPDDTWSDGGYLRRYSRVPVQTRGDSVQYGESDAVRDVGGDSDSPNI